MWRALLVLAVFAQPALADKAAKKPAKAAPDDAPDAVEMKPTPQHSEGDYGGVVPGQPRKQEPSKRPPKPPPKGTLAWVGFEPKSGGAEIFFQSVAPFEIQQHVENGTLVVNLVGLHRLGQNTWRPIDARFFETPIAKIVAKRVGASKKHPAGIEVRISFKNPKEAKEGTARSATEADGFSYVYLDFAAPPTTGTLQEPEK